MVGSRSGSQLVQPASCGARPKDGPARREPDDGKLACASRRCDRFLPNSRASAHLPLPEIADLYKFASPFALLTLLTSPKLTASPVSSAKPTTSPISSPKTAASPCPRRSPPPALLAGRRVKYGKKSWWKGSRRGRAGKGSWDPKEGKPPRAPTVLEGPVTRYVSVVLKKVGDDDDKESNLKLQLVPGTMTFAAFTMRARDALAIEANTPLQLFVGSRLERPDDAALMSSFPKEGYLYVSYQL